MESAAVAGEGPIEKKIVLSFGAGINARQKASDINAQECTRGENFDIDGASGALRRRRAFELISTAPNGQAIKGYAQLIRRDGTITTLIQAGTVVYNWDGATGFTQVGTVHGSSRLRGKLTHNWLLDQFVVITDLEKLTVVKKWDGTTFGMMPHDLGGDLYAKYAHIHDERVMLANVKTTIDTPHVLLACKQSDAADWSESDKPSSALGTDAPFFLIMPDFKPINGIEDAFGEDIISTEHGRLFKLSGSSAKDFSLDEFYAGSSASGDEALVNIGNDVAIGRHCQVELLSGTLNFGDVEADDLSFKIAPLILPVTDWIIIYDQHFQRVFCFPNNQSCVYVFHKTLRLTGQNLSPWSKWTTDHAIDFRPSCVMPIRDMATNENTVLMGDEIGNIYRIDGRGGADGWQEGGDAIAVAHELTPFVSVYPWLGGGLGGGIDAKFSDPVTLPTGDANGVAFSKAGDAIAVAHGTSPFVSVYPWSGAGFGLKFADPATLPASTGNGVAFSPAGDAIAIVHNTSPFVSVYPWSGAGFGVKFADPATLPAGTGNGVAFSPAGDAIAIAHNTSPFLSVYPWSAAGFGAKFTNPATLPIGTGTSVAFSPTGDAIAVGTGSSPFISVYPWSAAGFGIKIIDPATLPVDDVLGVAFSQAGDAIAVAHSTSPFVSVYPWSGLSFGAKFTNPATLPAGNGFGVAFRQGSGSLTTGQDITVSRVSGLIDLPDGDVFDVEGWIAYRKLFASTVTITLLHQGLSVTDQPVTISFPADAQAAIYGGSAYYNGAFYYGFSFSERINKQRFGVAGISSAIQVKTEVTGDKDFEIEEVGIKFRSRTQ